MKRLLFAVLGFALLGITPSAWCQGIDAKMRGEDSRLDKPVTISVRHIAIGELLHRFAEQTGVLLAIDEFDASSGYDLLAQCDHVAVGKMMDALYSLVSIHGAEWMWTRQGEPEKYSYRLVETGPAKERADHCLTLSRNALANYVELMNQLSDMEPSERSKHKKEVRTTLNFDSDAEANTFLSLEPIWMEAKLFFSVLSPEQQQQILAGGPPLIFQVDQLSPSLQQQFQAAFKVNGVQVQGKDGNFHPLPEPKAFSFHANSPKPASNQIVPMVWIQYPDGSGGTLFGSGYLSQAMKRLLYKAWFLPGDGKDSPADQNIVPNNPVQDNTEKQIVRSDGSTFFTYDASALPTHLMEMAQGGSIPLLAILTSNRMDIGAPSKSKVRDLLDNMQRGLIEMYKWRNDILLLNCPEWFLQKEPAVPYRSLRLLTSGKDGQLTLQGLVELNTKIDDQQVQWLGRHRGLVALHQLRPLLLYAEQHPSILTPKGAEVTIDDIRFFKALGYLSFDTPEDQPANIRLVFTDETTRGIQYPRIRVERYDSSSKSWIGSLVQDITTTRVLPP